MAEQLGYPEQVLTKFLPHIRKIAADAKERAKELALAHFQDPSAANKLAVDQALGRFLSWNTVEMKLLADPGFTGEFIHNLLNPPQAGAQQPAAAAGPNDSIAGKAFAGEGANRT